MTMTQHRFNRIRAQLELYERVDPDHLDLKPAAEMFADCRTLLREVLSHAEGAAPERAPWWQRLFGRS